MSLSKSEFDPKISYYNGNDVRIIDPNPFQEIVPHEDLFIYVSLRAKQKSKSILTETSDTTMTLVTENRSSIDLITPQQTIQGSKLFKSKPNLTTDWTEIGGNNFSASNLNEGGGKDFEGFGITNIDIEIKSQQTPKVTINFTDVRGATLFEQGSCSPYGLFFNLPYPMFELTVKGYYGRPVNYYLNLVKFNTKFNSSTGNMECTAEFIGYTFAFLSDTIVGYVAASQWLKPEYRAQDILRGKYEATRDFYRENGLTAYSTEKDNSKSGPWCDNPAIGEDRCTTIGDLLQQLDRFEKKDKPKIAGSVEYRELEALDALASDYQTYYKDVNDLIVSLQNTNKITPEESKSGRPGRTRFIFTPQQVGELIKTGGDLNLAFNKKNGSFLNNIKNIKSKEIPTNPVSYGDDVLGSSSACLTTADHTALSKKQPEEIIEIYDGLKDKDWHFNVLTSYIDANGKTQVDLVQPNSKAVGLMVANVTKPYIDFGFILESIETDLKALTGDGGIVTKKRNAALKEINRIVEERLGFKPTIRNVFSVLLCNTDAFMQILLEVYAKAEKYHSDAKSDYKSKQLTKDGSNSQILGAGSSTEVVYPWPTYFKKNYIPPGGSGINQGTREEYPGKDFPTWWEVIFVEDFIKAYMQWLNQLELLEGDFENKEGFDNYVPINPLESTLIGEDLPNKYYEKTTPTDIYRVIGERLFISLDHTLFQPIRMTADVRLMPLFDGNGSSWNPLKKNFDSDDSSVTASLGRLDAWNLLNTQNLDAGKKTIQIISQLDETSLRKEVIAALKKYYGANSFEENVLATDVLKFNGFLESERGYGINDSYITFKPIDPTDNVDKKVGLRMHSTDNYWVTPNPHDMDLEGEANLLFKIIDAPGGLPSPEKRKINISQPKFNTAIDVFGQALTKSTENINYSTQSYSLGTKIFQAVLETGGGGITPPAGGQANTQKSGYFIPAFSSPKLFTTLFMSKANQFGSSLESDWWGKNDDIGNLSNLPPGAMGSISYWDYTNFNETYGIALLQDDTTILQELNKNRIFDYNNPLFTGTLLTGNEMPSLKNEANPPDNEDIQPGDDINPGGDGISTPIVSTPFWLDNVNSFRIKAGGDRLQDYDVVTSAGGNLVIQEDVSDKIQNRNLAYIYLHTLKTTPFISRYTTDDGYLFDKSTGAKATNISAGSATGVSFIQSLRSLMITGGLSKVPKAWLLTLGAELWRWKMFVGTKDVGGKKVWNKPLTCVNCGPGDKPTGFDPLAQPGYNSLVGFTGEVYQHRKREKEVSQPLGVPNTSEIIDQSPAGVMDRNNLPIYLNKIYGWDLTKVIGYIQKSVFSSSHQSVITVSLSNNGNQNMSEGYYSSFRYFNIYNNRMGNLGLVLRKTNPSTTIVIDEKLETKEYSWSQNWVAPHHLMFVNPERFYDKDEGEGSGFVLTFENNVGYLDYPTIMPQVYNSPTDYFDDKDLSSGSYTKRSKSLDGNLGMVFQYIPDEVKNIIVANFEKWVDTEWGNILPIVDPVNFSTDKNQQMIGTVDSNYYEYNSVLTKDLLGNSDNSVFLTLKEKNNSTLDVRNKLLVDQYWLINSTPKIWYGIGTKDQPSLTTDPKSSESNQFFDSFLVRQKQFDLYIKSFINEFKKIGPEKIKELEDKAKKENSGNNILDDDDVKLSLYRTFKSISDKWISASKKPTGDPKKPSIFFNLIESGSGTSCKGSGTKSDKPNIQDGADGRSRTTLAAHFQYVNRVMGDIGDEAVIDISKFNEIKDNPKISLYQYLTDVLVENNYLFFPLPAFVNFTGNGLGEEDLKDMFRPVNSLESISCGPLFLSMYVGGSSRQLKMTPNASCSLDREALQNISDDSWNISRQDKDPSKSPLDASDPKAVNSNGYTAFKVVYGLESQNHFTSLQLDQSEFSETAESLQVIDKLSQQGGGDQTSKGQNLNSMYLTRSYSCTVESLGNCMIQPMTYFDLIGVPMFSGAYLITEVKHSFTPNNAKTTFKGTRQPRMTVPIVTDVAVAMNMSFKDITNTSTNTSLSAIGGGGGAGNSGGSGNSNVINTNAGVINGSISAPLLDEILAVMTKTKGVFYSDKAFTKKVGLSGLESLKNKRASLISDGIYDPNQPYYIYTDPFVINMVGIRNFAAGSSATNTFDDHLAVFYKDPACTTCKDNWQFKVYPITTDPGLKSGQVFSSNTSGPKAALGAGFMAEGQYVGSHLTGSHMSKYLALHNNRPIIVYRDNNNDDWADKNVNSLYVDTPGMNIHNSGTIYGVGGGNDVSNWSAGCQVFKSPKDYMEFMDIIFTKAQNPKAGGTTPVILPNAGQQVLLPLIPTGSTLKNGDVVPIRSFTYTLLNSAEFDKPKIPIGDPIYEHYVPGGPRSVGGGNNVTQQSNTKCTTKCTDINKVPWVSGTKTTLPFIELKNYLLTKVTAKQARNIFAIYYAEGSRDPKNTLQVIGEFVSASNGADSAQYNYTGIQTDNACWGQGPPQFIIGQTCLKDSKRYRAFGVFKNNTENMDFMIDKAKITVKYGYTFQAIDQANNATEWADSYLNSWVNLNLKGKNPTEYNKALPGKIAIYDTAVKLYDKLP